jgi:hypothetical protein
MQGVGLRKGDFNESMVTKMSKEPQVPLRGLIGNDHFEELADIKDSKETHNDVQEDVNVSVENDEFGIYDIVD